MVNKRVTMLNIHRNLAYIPLQTVPVAELSKTTAQRLLHWPAYLGAVPI